MEIRPTSTSGITGARVTDSVTLAEPTKRAQAGLAPTAVQSADAVTQADSVAPEGQVQDALKAINDTIKSLSQDLEFSIDPDSNRTVISVIDKQTSQILRQMPSKEALEIAKALDRLQGLLINQQA